jgi:hypothetical protein
VIKEVGLLYIISLRGFTYLQPAMYRIFFSSICVYPAVIISEDKVKKVKISLLQAMEAHRVARG